MPEAGVVIAQCATFPYNECVVVVSRWFPVVFVHVFLAVFVFADVFFGEGNKRSVDSGKNGFPKSRVVLFSKRHGPNMIDFRHVSHNIHHNDIFDKDFFGVHNFLKIQQLLIHMKENSLKHHETSWK